VLILQVNKNGENEKDDRTHHDALFVHEGDRSAKSPDSAELETAGSKVNDQAKGVKRRG
jgi:hypothetical protein